MSEANKIRWVFDGREGNAYRIILYDGSFRTYLYKGYVRKPEDSYMTLYPWKRLNRTTIRFEKRTVLLREIENL